MTDDTSRLRIPTPDEIAAVRDPSALYAARLACGLTQQHAGELVHTGYRTWQDWESGRRRMPAAAAELFLLKRQL